MSTDHLPKDWMRTIIDLGHESPEIAEIWLFGSYSRKEERPDSDLDLAVILNPQLEEAEAATWMFNAPGWREKLAQLPVEVQLEHLQDTNEVVNPQIKLKGIRIYPRE
jgi:predicted nucleotidyltransferase